jgi:hypothetical protein
VLHGPDMRHVWPIFDDEDSEDEDGGPGNGARANWAAAALTTFAYSTGQNGESVAQVMADLLGDLHHLTDYLGLDFDAIVEHGAFHYAHEVKR